MNYKYFYVLGTVFIISSSFIYTVERGFAYYSWIGQKMSVVGGGSYPSNPQLPDIFTNMFVPLFILAGIILWGFGYKKGKNSGS